MRKISLTCVIVILLFSIFSEFQKEGNNFFLLVILVCGVLFFILLFILELKTDGRLKIVNSFLEKEHFSSKQYIPIDVNTRIKYGFYFLKIKGSEKSFLLHKNNKTYSMLNHIYTFVESNFKDLNLPILPYIYIRKKNVILFLNFFLVIIFLALFVFLHHFVCILFSIILIIVTFIHYFFDIKKIVIDEQKITIFYPFRKEKKFFINAISELSLVTLDWDFKLYLKFKINNKVFLMTESNNSLLLKDIARIYHLFKFLETEKGGS